VPLAPDRSSILGEIIRIRSWWKYGSSYGSIFLLLPVTVSPFWFPLGFGHFAGGMKDEANKLLHNIETPRCRSIMWSSKSAILKRKKFPTWARNICSAGLRSIDKKEIFTYGMWSYHCWYLPDPACIVNNLFITFYYIMCIKLFLFSSHSNSPGLFLPPKDVGHTPCHRWVLGGVKRHKVIKNSGDRVDSGGLSYRR